MNKLFILIILEIGLVWLHMRKKILGGWTYFKMCCAAGVLHSAVGTEVPWPWQESVPCSSVTSPWSRWAIIWSLFASIFPLLFSCCYSCIIRMDLHLQILTVLLRQAFMEVATTGLRITPISPLSFPPVLEILFYIKEAKHSAQQGR